MNSFLVTLLTFSIHLSFALIENPLENPRNYKTGEEVVSLVKEKKESKKKILKISRNYKSPMKVDTVISFGFVNGPALKRNYKQP